MRVGGSRRAINRSASLLRCGLSFGVHIKLVVSLTHAFLCCVDLIVASGYFFVDGHAKPCRGFELEDMG